MVEILKTKEFMDWADKLSDEEARTSVGKRLDRIRKGNFGHSERLTPRVSEIKIDVGKGYRIYYSKFAEKVVILLAGGDKKSQRRDIKKAEEIFKRVAKKRKEH